MDSRLGNYLLAMLPNVRRRKDYVDSALAKLLDAIGTELDDAKDTVQTLRRRACIWIADGAHAYYATVERTADLNLHALDRGTRRLAGETDTALRQRLQAMPRLRQYMGSAMGMKYLVEEVLGHTLTALVVYAADPQAQVILSGKELGLYAERDLSHVFSAADQADTDNDVYRQNRIYSEADLDFRFQFWMSITPAAALSSIEEDRIVELINQEKPAHTVARVHFVED